MEVDLKETMERMKSEAEAASAHEKRLNSMVAVTIAILATFMGICKVKDDNTVQSMQQVQADKLDYWSWYQASHIRQDMANSAARVLRAVGAASNLDKAAVEDAAAAFEKDAGRQEEKRNDLKAKADASQKQYDELNFHDDQFDLMDASLAIAIATLAITSLTQVVWLYWLSLVPSVFGVVMGVSGLFGWSLHPDALAKWLGA
jgi:hypothetical protein